MKAHTITWSTTTPVTERSLELKAPAPIRAALGAAPRALLAAIPAMALLVGSAWMVDSAVLAPYLQALLWSAGFIFLALAIEAEGPGRALLLAATGIVLPALAWLGSRVSGEFSLVASALVAAWLLAALLRR